MITTYCLHRKIASQITLNKSTDFPHKYVHILEYIYYVHVLEYIYNVHILEYIYNVHVLEYIYNVHVLEYIYNVFSNKRP